MQIAMLQSRIFLLKGDQDFILKLGGQFALVEGERDDEVDIKLRADAVKFKNRLCDILSLELCALHEAIKIHGLDIMVLRDNTAYKTDELVAVADGESGYVNVADPVIQIVHMFIALVQINNAAGSRLNLRVHTRKNIRRLPFSLVTND